jgi:hypothetical protein
LLQLLAQRWRHRAAVAVGVARGRGSQEIIRRPGGGIRRRIILRRAAIDRRKGEHDLNGVVTDDNRRCARRLRHADSAGKRRPQHESETKCEYSAKAWTMVSHGSSSLCPQKLRAHTHARGAARERPPSEQHASCHRGDSGFEDQWLRVAVGASAVRPHGGGTPCLGLECARPHAREGTAEGCERADRAAVVNVAVTQPNEPAGVKRRELSRLAYGTTTHNVVRR